MDMIDDNGENLPKGVVFSKRIKAGKRVYFIDIKQTRNEDYYIALTESKKSFNGTDSEFIRHKILIYKEDFNKVQQGLNEAIELIRNEYMPDYDFTAFDNQEADQTSDESINKTISNSNLY